MPGTAGYLASAHLRLSGPLNSDAVHSALTEIVTRHEVLRTSIIEADGDIVGILRSPTEFQVVVDQIEPDGLVAAIRAEAARPLDIGRELPLRARLLRLAEDDHVLCLVAHHVAVDRESLRVIYQELAFFYDQFLLGKGDRLPSPPQFRDVAMAEDASQDAGDLAPLLAARERALSGLSPFELPTDHVRPRVRSGEGVLSHSVDLPRAVVDGVARIGRDRAATRFMVLLAACGLLLYRYTGRTDVTTGMSSTTRNGSRGDGVIGPFLNMLVVPADVSGNPTFAELVDRVRDLALDAYEARMVPFDSLVTELGVERDAARTPVFQILVDHMSRVDPMALTGMRVEELPTPGSGAKYDLTVEFREHADGLSFMVERDTALYEAATAMRLMAHLRSVLVAVTENPSLRVDEVPVLGPDEVDEAIRHGTAEPADDPGRCLHDLFADQVRRSPDAVAVCDGGTSMTYTELDRYSTAVANGLVAHGVGPDAPVGIRLERSAALVAAVLGVLKAGGAYVPIDPDAPPERVRTLLTVSQASVCVVPPRPAVEGAEPADRAVREAGCDAVDLDTLARTTGRTAPAVGPDHLCSVYFTSGSTGRPKAVGSTHRGWVGQMLNMQRCYRLEPGEAMLLKTPLSFDDVAREIFWPLMVGGRVAILPTGLHHDPRAILAAAIEHRIVWLQFVPSTLALFLDEVGPEHLDGLSHLRHLVSDGDRLRPAMVGDFFDKLGRPGRQLNNHWGTTEVSIDTTHHICTRSDADEADAVILGEPMAHNCVYLLDDALQLVPRRAVGELCIGGIGLARGYLGEPGRTARAFVPHPWQPGERLYRTGDLGRIRADGSLEYRGRRDHQMKVRGVRIELGEVEAVIRAFDGVTDVVVAAWEPVPGDSRLIAYVTFAGDSPAAPAQLREFLGGRLPQAAVPSAIMPLPSLPRTPSGKIDRRSLPSPDPDELREERFAPPATDAEQALVHIWAAVLGIRALGVNDDFFAVGGHSLLVTRAVNRMRDAFAVDVPVRLVFECPTVRHAAVRIEELVLADIESMSDAEIERASAEFPEFRQA